MDHSLGQGTTLIRAFSTVTEEMPTSDRGGYITGLATDSKGNILAVDNQAKVVKVFDHTGVFKYCFGENILKSPWDVFTTSSGKIAVSDPGNADIKVFSRSGKYLLSSEKGHHLNFPQGVDYHPWSKETVIADSGFSCVYVHDPKGNVKDMITKQDDQYGLGSPSYACFDYAGNIYVTDSEDQSLIAYDTDRNHLFTYGHPNYDDGNEDIELNNPGSVIVDRFSNIILADTGNCRVHLIDKNGQLKDYLLTWEDGLGEPQAMTLSDDGQLIISEANTGIIKIFSYLHLPIVNEIKLCINKDGEYDVETIDSGSTLCSDSDLDSEDQDVKQRRSSKSAKQTHFRTSGNFSANRKEVKEPLRIQEKQKSAHEFRSKLETLSGKAPIKSMSNFTKPSQINYNNTDTTISHPLIKGILKKSGKTQFDFFTPNNDNRNVADIPVHDNSNETLNIDELLLQGSADQAASQRNMQSYSGRSRKSSAPKSLRSYNQSELSRLNSSTPSQAVKTKYITDTSEINRAKSASTVKSSDTGKSDLSSVPVIIIDKPQKTSAMQKLNFHLNKSTGVGRSSKAYSTASKSTLYKPTSTTSMISISSKSSQKSQKNSGLAIDNISEIPKENDFSNETNTVDFSELTMEPFNDEIFSNT